MATLLQLTLFFTASRTESNSQLNSALIQSRSQSHIANDGQSVSKSWCDIYYCLTVTVLFLWGTLSDEKMDLSFVYAAGPCQHSLSRVQVLWDSQPYFTVSDLRLLFLSPTSRRVTVEVFNPTSTWVCQQCDLILATGCHYIDSAQTIQKTQPLFLMKLVYHSVA
jgi:hypothetical protein